MIVHTHTKGSRMWKGRTGYTDDSRMALKNNFDWKYFDRPNRIMSEKESERHKKLMSELEKEDHQILGCSEQSGPYEPEIRTQVHLKPLETGEVCRDVLSVRTNRNNTTERQSVGG